MKHLGRIAALAGLLGSAWLVWRDHPATVFALMRVAGLGLGLAALAHVLPMLANALAWQTLLRRRDRPSAWAMWHLVWLREAVNGLLPVARVGGEIVSFRLLRQRGLRAAPAAASLIVDTQLTMIGQLLFTLFGLGFLFAHAASAGLRLAGHLAWGVAALAPLLVLFALVQHVRPFERAARLINRATGGKLASLVGPSVNVDRSIKLIWRRPAAILSYLLIWHPLQCLGVALELWLALHFIGAPLSLLQSVVFESLIQAVSSAAFFVPGALGIQEGGFVVIGGALGLPADACLALAGARRIRDLLIYVPGLLAWQVAESSLAAPAQRN